MNRPDGWYEYLEIHLNKVMADIHPPCNSVICRALAEAGADAMQAIMIRDLKEAKVIR